MKLVTETVFYKNARKDLEEFIANGGKIEELSSKDPLYMRIKNTRFRDENGNKLTVEEKFELLGFPRKRKYSLNVRGDLINSINEYINNGGSLHIERKKLPFYTALETYSKILKRQGITMTHEQIMKEDLGFKEYSDDYHRTMPLFKIYEYEDKNGYVDDFKTNRVLANFVKDLAITYDVPYYFIIVFLADKKLKRYNITVDKIKYIEKKLKNYAATNKSFVGMRRKDPVLFEQFSCLIKYYSDGSEQVFSKQEWLSAFGLGDIDNRFRDSGQDEIDVDDIMLKIKSQNPSGYIYAKDLDLSDYRKIVKKSVAMGVSVSGLFNAYGIKCKGSSIERLTRVYVEDLPYMEEMKNMFDKLIIQSGKTEENNCKEELLEVKIDAMKQVYAAFKEKLDNYTPKDITFEDEDNLTV